MTDSLRDVYPERAGRTTYIHDRTAVIQGISEINTKFLHTNGLSYQYAIDKWQDIVSFGFDVQVDHLETNQSFIVEGGTVLRDFGDVHVAHIKDYELFIRQVYELDQIMSSHEFSGGSRMVWRPMMVEDFDDVNQYLEECKFAYSENSYESLDSWALVGATKEQGKLWVQRQKSRAGAETPYEFKFAVGWGDTVSQENEIHSVKFMRTQPDRAVIKAIQMPVYGDFGEENIEHMIDILRVRSQFWKEYVTWIAKSYPRDFTRVTGITDSALFDEAPEQMIVHFIESMREKARQDDDAISHWGNVRSSYLPDNHPLSWFGEQLFEIYSSTVMYQTGEHGEELRQTRAMYKARRENLKALNSKKRSIVHPAVALSVATAVHMLHADGVRQIDIPLYLPGFKHGKKKPVEDGTLKPFDPLKYRKLKLHEKVRALIVGAIDKIAKISERREKQQRNQEMILGDELDFRILDQLERTTTAISRIFKGSVTVDETTVDNGHLTLYLADTLHIADPVIAQILQ